MRKRVLIIFLCYIYFSTVICEKEKVQDESLEQITDQLLHEIEKRLQAHDTPESSSVGCKNAKNATNKIIKSKQSIAAGAVFLDSPDSTSPVSCQDQCCARKDCNVAVFKNKDGETSCYMFNCGNPSVCEFMEHEGFIVFSIPNKKTSKPGVAHEDDLERLAAPTTTTTQSTTTPTTTTSTTTTTTTTTTPIPTTSEKKHHVSLFGECTEDDQCSDSYAVCLAGFCVCNQGYTYQESVCRPDCTKFQFKCANERQPLAYPQCIAIYDKCDGIIHCKDGSDEVGCPTESNIKESQDDGNKNVGSSDKTGNKDASTTVKTIKPTVSTEKPESHTDKEQTTTTTQKTTKQNPTTTPTVNQDQSSEQKDNKAAETNVKDNNQSQEDNSGSESSKDSDIGKSNSSEGKTEKDDKSSNQSENTKNTDNLEAKQENPDVQQQSDGDSYVGIVEEKLVIQSNKGAVVALSLGLIITFLLLVFVGCRLRNVRKKLRHGRPMSSNEADYLINGMYL